MRDCLGGDAMTSDKPRYHPYGRPAVGWGAAGATAKALMQQSVISSDGIPRRVEGLAVLDYSELNPLLPLHDRDEISRAPTAKSIPARAVSGEITR
jgi:hypothetical protein